MFKVHKLLVMAVRFLCVLLVFMIVAGFVPVTARAYNETDWCDENEDTNPSSKLILDSCGMKKENGSFQEATQYYDGTLESNCMSHYIQITVPDSSLGDLLFEIFIRTLLLYPNIPLLLKRIFSLINVKRPKRKKKRKYILIIFYLL